MNNKRSQTGSSHLILIIALVLVVLGGLCYVYWRNYMQASSAFVNNKSLLSCSLSEYENTYKANISADINISFDKTGIMDIANGAINYKFDSRTEFDSWRRSYSSNNSVVNGILGMSSKTEFNNNDKVMKVTINQKYSEIPDLNKTKDFPATYNDLKTYFLNLGYNCNGESGNKKDSSNVNKSGSNTRGVLFPVSDKITATNNEFEYKDYKWDSNSEFKDSAFLWEGIVKNITSRELKNNIHIKFYDFNKNCIGDHQKEIFAEIDKSGPYWERLVVKPNSTSNFSFTFYTDDLYEGHTISEVKYVSIEDINY